MKHYVLQFIAPEKLMLLFKCFIYSGVCMNGYEFITDEFNASVHLITAETTLHEFIGLFAVTMDTIAWIALLLVFELETYFLEDETMEQKAVKWSLNILAAICYFFIVNAFIGYLGKLFVWYDVVPFVGNPCDLINTDIVFTFAYDEYANFTQANCLEFDPNAMVQVVNQPIVIKESFYPEVKIMSWVDVVNSGTWLLVVIMLQVDIILQMRDKLTKRIMHISWAIKGVLYSTLFVTAGFWWKYGSFTDFYDAVLWLLGFMIIDLNIFNWNKEVEEEKALEQQQAATAK